MILETSKCFDDLRSMAPDSVPGVRFVSRDLAGELLKTVKQRLGSETAFYWGMFARHGIPAEEAWNLAARWQGANVYACFLDYDEPDVAEIAKNRAAYFYDEIAYPTEDTYIVSEDLRRAICFDHNQVIHATELA